MQKNENSQRIHMGKWLVPLSRWRKQFAVWPKYSTESGEKIWFTYGYFRLFYNMKVPVEFETRDGAVWLTEKEMMMHRLIAYKENEYV